jgi:hypothetical protein
VKLGQRVPHVWPRHLGLACRGVWRACVCVCVCV